MQNPNRRFRFFVVALLFIVEFFLALNLYSGLRYFNTLMGEDQSVLGRALTIAQLQTAIPATNNPAQEGSTIPEVTTTPAASAVPSATQSPTPMPTWTWTALPTWTQAPTKTATATVLPPTPVPPTPVPPTATALPSATFTPTQTPIPPTATPQPTPTMTPVPPTSSPTVLPTASATPTNSATPEPTATAYYITPTPVAEGLFAAATQVAQVTADALTTGTATPLPANWRVYTIRILPYVPTPANQATAEYLAMEATARAITTGEPPAGILFWTATPRPTNTLLPTLPPTLTSTPTTAPLPSATPTPQPSPTATATQFVVTATFTPENVLVAATVAARITADALSTGTATPLPMNAVTATFTPRPIVVTNTPTPANNATATALALEATAIAFTTGTPDTSRFITATPTAPRPFNSGPPTRTPTPIVFALSDLTATPTAAATSVFPVALVGKILFLGDMDGRGAPEAYSMDPDGSNVMRLSSREFYDRVAERDSYSGDRRFQAFVKREEAGTRERQIYAYDAFYGTERQLTNMKSGSTSWDPAWSPTAELIAFVSNQTDSDEIWVVERESKTVTQLTFNDGPWDKHPSWSPDGTQIVFISSRTGQREIWIMGSDGSNQRQLTSLGFEAWDPVWVKYGDQ